MLGNAVGGGEEKPGYARGEDVHELAEADDHSTLHLLEIKSLIRKKTQEIYKALKHAYCFHCVDEHDSFMCH